MLARRSRAGRRPPFRGAQRRMQNLPACLLKFLVPEPHSLEYVPRSVKHAQTERQTSQGHGILSQVYKNQQPLRPLRRAQGAGWPRDAAGASMAESPPLWQPGEKKGGAHAGWKRLRHDGTIGPFHSPRVRCAPGDSLFRHRSQTFTGTYPPCSRTTRAGLHAGPP